MYIYSRTKIRSDLLVSVVTLFPLWLTQYRWAPVKVIINKQKKGFKELSTVVSFAGLLGKVTAADADYSQ